MKVRGSGSLEALPLEYCQRGKETPESRTQSPKQHRNPTLLSKLDFFPSSVCFLSHLRDGIKMINEERSS